MLTEAQAQEAALTRRIADLYRSMRSRKRADIDRRGENEAIVAQLTKERDALRRPALATATAA